MEQDSTEAEPKVGVNMYLLITELFAIAILALITANLTISLLILRSILSSIDKANNIKRRMFPFWSWMEKHHGRI